MISTHVLDTARGRPAAGVQVTLEAMDGSRADGGSGREIARASTDADGRVRELAAGGAALGPGRYRIRFDTAAYFSALGTEAFYPEVSVVFVIDDASQHYHVPLLLSPFGYSTYRGS
jgi:5-hydroxyisourate hydrolase